MAKRKTTIVIEEEIGTNKVANVFVNGEKLTELKTKKKKNTNVKSNTKKTTSKSTSKSKTTKSKTKSNSPKTKSPTRNKKNLTSKQENINKDNNDIIALTNDVLLNKDDLKGESSAKLSIEKVDNSLVSINKDLEKVDSKIIDNNKDNSKEIIDNPEIIDKKYEVTCETKDKDLKEKLEPLNAVFVDSFDEDKRDQTEDNSQIEEASDKNEISTSTSSTIISEEKSDNNNKTNTKDKLEGKDKSKEANEDLGSQANTNSEKQIDNANNTSNNSNQLSLIEKEDNLSNNQNFLQKLTNLFKNKNSRIMLISGAVLIIVGAILISSIVISGISKPNEYLEISEESLNDTSFISKENFMSNLKSLSLEYEDLENYLYIKSNYTYSSSYYTFSLESTGNIDDYKQSIKITPLNQDTYQIETNDTKQEVAASQAYSTIENYIYNFYDSYLTYDSLIKKDVLNEHLNEVNPKYYIQYSTGNFYIESKYYKFNYNNLGLLTSLVHDIPGDPAYLIDKINVEYSF